MIQCDKSLRLLCFAISSSPPFAVAHSCLCFRLTIVTKYIQLRGMMEHILNVSLMFVCLVRLIAQNLLFYAILIIISHTQYTKEICFFANMRVANCLVTHSFRQYLTVFTRAEVFFLYLRMSVTLSQNRLETRFLHSIVSYRRANRNAKLCARKWKIHNSFHSIKICWCVEIAKQFHSKLIVSCCCNGRNGRIFDVWR